MSLTDSPSLASITGTHLDSACKHIQQCKVSYDHMLLFVENADELDKEKMKYCAHKDEMIVGIGRPWKRPRVRMLPASAYPRIISNLGNISRDDAKYKIPRKMITFLFHVARDVLHREHIVNHMDKNQGFHMMGEALKHFPDRHYFYEENNRNTDQDGSRRGRVRDGRIMPRGDGDGQGDEHEDDGKNFTPLGNYLSKMFDYYPVGVSNTIAYANPRTGDTVGSVMIGGLRTVMNGDWEVQAGDLVQWYWTFEKDCFRADGARKRYMIYDEKGEPELDYFGLSPFDDVEDDLLKRQRGGRGLMPAVEPRGEGEEADEIPGRGHETAPGLLPFDTLNKSNKSTTDKAADARRNFSDRQYGIKPQSLTPSDKAKSVARIKTYVHDPLCPRLYDRLRVFARAIATARPGELLDIQISRQSM